MDDFNQRQALLVLEFIERYKRNDFDLNILVQRLEGLRAVLTLEELKVQLEPLTYDLEVTNACALEDSKGVLTPLQRTEVMTILSKIIELTKFYLHVEDWRGASTWSRLQPTAQCSAHEYWERRNGVHQPGSEVADRPPPVPEILCWLTVPTHDSVNNVML